MICSPYLQTSTTTQEGDSSVSALRELVLVMRAAVAKGWSMTLRLCLVLLVTAVAGAVFVTLVVLAASLRRGLGG